MSFIINDAINCSPDNNFTQISNNLLRDPELSFKAKAVLCCLLSNKDGWTSYENKLVELSTDGISSVRSAIKELQENGYLLKIYFRDRRKRRAGSFWAYTDTKYKFKITEQIKQIKEAGYFLEKQSKELLEKLDIENLDIDNPDIENHKLIILNNNNTNNKNKKTIPLPSRFKDFIDQFRNIQKENNPNIKSLRKELTKKQYHDQYLILKRLSKLDGYNYSEEIKPAILWAVYDTFWSPNLLSLNSLRNKSNNGLTKFENVLNQYKKKGSSKFNKNGGINSETGKYDDIEVVTVDV